jgi:hypothetical protein
MTPYEHTPPCQVRPSKSSPSYLSPFPAAAALLVVLLPAAGAGSGSLGGASARGVRLRLAGGFALLLEAASGRGKAGSSREGALRLREVLKDVGGGLGTTIGDTAFGFGVVMVVAVVGVAVVVERVGFDFDLPRVVGVRFLGVEVRAEVRFDEGLFFFFGVVAGPAFGAEVEMWDSSSLFSSSFFPPSSSSVRFRSTP